MIYYPTILVDTGLLVAFYDSGDRYHTQEVEFFASCKSRLVTTVALYQQDLLQMWNTQEFRKLPPLK